MAPLDRKLLRDLLHLRGQIAAISVVVLCGVATVVAMRTAYRSLSLSQASYYAGYRFADVFAQVKRAPEPIARRVAAIPGVTAAQSRIVVEVTLDVPGLAEPATGRLVSIPDRRAPMLNDLHLRRGRWIEPGRRDEVLASEAFAAANRLEPGDAVDAVINGRWQRLRIVGVALSPEYIYEIRPASLFPDNRRFGVLWMSRDALEAAFDMKGAFNDLSLSLARGADQPDVIARVDRLLARYGGLGAYGRDDQLSNRFISDEIKQTRVSGTIIPAIFLGIAAFLLNIVLSRLVATQRDQIAVLKAFGYSNGVVGLHYLKLAFVGLLVGALGGLALGTWIGALLNRQYTQFYRFPVFAFELDATALGLAVLTTAFAAGIGALNAVRRAVALPPAEAMRPEGPGQFRPGIVEWVRADRWLALPARIIARNLERRPVKAGLSVLGIALAIATLVVGRFFLDAIRYIADVQFREVQRENVTVVFNQPRSAQVVHELAVLPGVLHAEPFRLAPARLRFAHRSRRVGLLGLPQDGQLRRMIDRSRRIVALPAEGLVLTRKLGEILGVRPGDTLAVEFLEGDRATRAVVVSGFVDEMVGISAYMSGRALHRLVREGGTVSGAFLMVDALAQDSLFGLLKRMPAVGGTVSRDATLASFEQTLQQSIGITMTILVGFAAAIAFAMVYNAARIALSERGRELASLRVLGFTRREVTTMLLGEQAVLTVAAIPMGLTLGYLIAVKLAGLYQWELFRVPLIISRFTYAYAVVTVAIAAILSGVGVRRRLNRLDLVQVLKTRE
ncbi:MAG: FtsX-like permease family protein [Gemmatimonadetes bacterium]|nr:FtsX-like permease family protein [Gemmatimonadota bacterium]